MADEKPDSSRLVLLGRGLNELNELSKFLYGLLGELRRCPGGLPEAELVLVERLGRASGRVSRQLRRLLPAGDDSWRSW